MEVNEIQIARDLELSMNRDTLKKELEQDIVNMLNRLGVYYRCFSRVKEPSSIERKLKIKNYSEKKKMQDLCGVRIALYYRDDIDVVQTQIQKVFKCVEIVKDMSDVEEFKPERLNIVALLPTGLDSITNDGFFEKYNIDKTFEIQIRTIFSEGWHEIEHDMRYKCKDSWDDYKEYSRALNGVWATLCTCDWTIIQLFNDLAYANYKNGLWEEMIRNKFRLKMRNGNLSSDIEGILSKNAELSKAVFRYDRSLIIGMFSESRIAIPITADNIVKIINMDLRISEELKDSTSTIIKDLFENNELQNGKI